MKKKAKPFAHKIATLDEVEKVVDFNELVNATSQKIYDLIKETVRPLESGQRFLIASRIVTRLFQGHFRLGMFFAEEQIEKHENGPAARAERAFEDQVKMSKANRILKEKLAEAK